MLICLKNVSLQLVSECLQESISLLLRFKFLNKNCYRNRMIYWCESAPLWNSVGWHNLLHFLEEHNSHLLLWEHFDIFVHDPREPQCSPKKGDWTPQEFSPPSSAVGNLWSASLLNISCTWNLEGEFLTWKNGKISVRKTLCFKKYWLNNMIFGYICFWKL
jgi:hypothetical protein